MTASRTTFRRTLHELGARRVAVILGVCLLARLSLFLALGPWQGSVERDRILQGDPLGYHLLATTVIESGRFAHGADEPPNALRTPGYPLFLAAIYAVFGPRPWVALLFQILADTGACLILLVTVSRLLGRRSSLVAGAFYAMAPTVALYSSTTLASDSLFVAILIAALSCLERGRSTRERGPRPRCLVYGAILLGLATLVRPIGQFAILGLLVYVVGDQRRHLRRAAAYAVACGAAFAAVLTPWMVRNHVTFGHFELSTSGAYNLLILNAVPVRMHQTGHAAEQVKADLLREADSRMEADGIDPGGVDGFVKVPYWKGLALEVIRDDLPGFARSYALGVVHMMGALATAPFAAVLGFQSRPFDVKSYTGLGSTARGFVETKGGIALLLAGLVAFILVTAYGGALAGLWEARKRPDRGFLALVAFVAVYFVLVTGVAGLARFKLPAVPFYLVFTGLGYATLQKRRWRPEEERQRPAGG